MSDSIKGFDNTIISTHRTPELHIPDSPEAARIADEIEHLQGRLGKLRDRRRLDIVVAPFVAITSVSGDNEQDVRVPEGGRVVLNVRQSGDAWFTWVEGGRDMWVHIIDVLDWRESKDG
jgi:hypothetical protein